MMDENDIFNAMQEALKDPMINIMFLGMIARKDGSGFISKFIQTALDHGMPFHEVGGFINDLMGQIRVFETDPEKALYEALFKKADEGDGAKE